jgi:hypothetical protein
MDCRGRRRRRAVRRAVHLFLAPLAGAAIKPAPVVAAPPPAEEDVIKHPIAAAPGESAAPPLEASDQPLFDALAGVAGKAPVEQFVIPQDLVRHFVVTVDNLPTEKVAERVRPMKAVPGRFAVGGSEDALTLDAANFARYEPLVKTLVATDTAQLVAIYQRYYPLFQQVYEGLGHPPQYFNDRMVEVIDHLLSTPDVRGPIALVQPGVQVPVRRSQARTVVRGTEGADPHGQRECGGDQGEAARAARRVGRADTVAARRCPSFPTSPSMSRRSSSACEVTCSSRCASRIPSCCAPSSRR